MSLRPYDLTCEHQRQALGVGTSRPSFGWKLEAPDSKAHQTAYQVIITDDIGISLLDTGKVCSDAQIGIEVNLHGILQPFERYHFTVRVWCNEDPQPQSTDSYFVTGVFKANQWPGDWFDKTWGPFGRVLFCRQTFELPAGSIDYAYLYVGSVGEKAPATLAFVNGADVGNLLNFPGATEGYHAFYACVDVKDMLLSGRNVLGLMTIKRASCILKVRYLDGRCHLTHADFDTWRWKLGGPYIELGYERPMWRGKLERYDARCALPGWNTPGFNDSDWPTYRQEVGNITWAPLFISPQYCTAREWEAIMPVRLLRHHDCWFADFGANLTGNVSFRLRSKKGTTVEIRYAEKCKGDRCVYPAGFEEFPALCTYTFASDADEEYRPRFMMIGFRCIEIYGFDGEIGPDDLTAHFIHSDVVDQSEFSCSDTVLNQLHSVARRSFLCNLVNIPTDCPERERRGWTADAYAVSEAECVSFSMLNFYTQWFISMRDCQRGNGWIPVELPITTEDCIDVNWPVACMLIPWEVYRQYGDVRFLRDNYTMMKRYIALLLGICDEQYGLPDMFLSYKDWLAIEPASSGFIGMAYFYRCISLLAKISGILGENTDCENYQAKSAAILEALNKKYLHINVDGAFYDNNTQSANAHALFFNICPATHREAVAASLARNIHEKGANTTGFMGTMCLLQALSQTGHSSTAYTLLQNRKIGGWRYLIERCDATTFPENYDGSGSQNHAFLGSAPGLWLYKYLVGIAPAAPGYKTINIHPYVPDGLDWAEAAVETPYGVVRVRWEKAGQQLLVRADIPIGATATLTYSGTQIKLVSGQHNVKLGLV